MEQDVVLAIKVRNEAKAALQSLGLDLKGVGGDAKTAMAEVQKSGLMAGRVLTGVEKATEQLAIKQAKYNDIVAKHGAASLQARTAAIGLSDAQARLAKETDKASGALSKGSTGLKGFVTSLGRIGLAGMGIGAITSAVGVASDAIGGLIDKAEGLADSQARVNLVFKENAGEVSKWAGTNAVAFGLSKQAALDAAGGLGQYLTNLGVTEKASASMSTSSVELAAKLAAFSGKSTEEAMAAIQKGLGGATKGLKDMGIAIGPIPSSLDSAGKAQFVYNEILKQSANAQAAWADNSGDVDMSLKRVSAAVENAKASIGEKLLPVIAPLAEAFADKLPGALDAASKGLDKLQPVFSAVVSLVQGGAKLIGDTVAVLAKGWDEDWGGIRSTVTKVIDKVSDVMAKLGPVVMNVWNGQIRPAIQTFLGWWQSSVAPTITAVGNIIGKVMGVIVNFMVNNWGTIQSVVSGVVSVIQGVIEVGFNVISGIVNAAMALIRGDFSGAWSALSGAAKGAIDGVVKIISGLGGILLGQAKLILAAVGQIGANIVEGIKGGIYRAWTGFLTWIHDQIMKIPEAVRKVLGIKSPSTVMIEIGEQITEGLLQGITQRLPALQDTVSDLWQLLQNRPDFAGQYQRFFDVIDAGADKIAKLGQNLEGIYELSRSAGSALDLLAGGGLIGAFGDDSAFQQFFGADVQDWFRHFVLEPTKEEADVVRDIVGRMAKLQDTAKNAGTEEERKRALEAELKLYPQLIDAERTLEDARYSAAKTALQNKQAEKGNAGNLVLIAQLKELEEAHAAVTAQLDRQEDRYNRIAAGEARYNDQIQADIDAINQALQDQIDKLEQERDDALDAAEQVHDSIMAKLEEEAHRRELAHNVIMQHIADEKTAEDDRDRRVLDALDEQQRKQQAIIDADSKHLDDMHWQLKQLEHDAANDPALKAAQTAVSDIDQQILNIQTSMKATVDLFKDLQRIDPRDSSEKRQAAAKARREEIGLNPEQVAALNARLGQGGTSLTAREARVAALLGVGMRVRAGEVEALLKKLGLTGQGDPSSSPEVKLLQAQRAEHQKVIDARQDEIDKLKAQIAEEEYQAETRKRQVDVVLADIEAKRKAEEALHGQNLGAIAAEEKAENDRYDAEKLRIEAVMKMEDERHKQRVKALQEEYALLLMQANPNLTDSQIQAILAAQAQRAAQIAADAQAQFEEYLKSLSVASGQRAGGAVTQPAPGGGSPGIEPPAKPGTLGYAIRGLLATFSDPVAFGESVGDGIARATTGSGVGAASRTRGTGYGTGGARRAATDDGLGGWGRYYWDEGGRQHMRPLAGLPTTSTSGPATITIQSATIVASHAQIAADGDVVPHNQSITVQVGEKIIEEIVRSNQAGQAKGKASRTAPGV